MLSSAELCLVADEIQRLAVPSRVDKIHQPRHDRLVLRLSREGADHDLLIAAARGFARAHFVEEPPANPRTPPPFCEEVRALLGRARLVGAATLPHDAVLLLDFDVRGEDGATLRRRLVAELFGAHPNILVLSADGSIEAVLVPRESRGRRLFPGERWAAPPRREKELAPKPPFSDLGAPGAGGLSPMLERAVGSREAEAALGQARDAFLADLAQQRKKLARLLENLQADQKSAGEIPRLRREGELLKAHVGRMKRGMKEIAVPDWNAEPPGDVRIALDPRRAPQEEVAFRFDEARRLERLAETAAARRAEVEEKLEALDALATRVSAAASEDELAEIRDAAGVRARPQAVPGRKPKVEPRKPYRTFVSKDGIEMLVGRTAADNDELTFKIANGNDFWLHVRDYPGSHVVIRARDELPEQTLLDAATLAVHFSRGAKGGKRDVSWTRRKYVSKARGAPAGQVLLSSHKTIHLRPDPDRLARLLKGTRG